ncbi:dienelactone hydrolase family protein [Gordonia sinesedis]
MSDTSAATPGGPVAGATVDVSTPDGTVEAFVAKPTEAHGLLPGVLFFIDAFGLRDRTRRMVEEIASWGYIVMAPNVFHRLGSIDDLDLGDLTDDEHREAIFGDAMSRVGTLTDEIAERDLPAYLDALQSLPGVADGPVAVTGYCMGGRLAFLAAALRPDDVAAVALFHTGRLVTDEPNSPHLRAGDLTATVLAVHADHDRSMPPEAIAQFEHALADAGVPHSTSVYPGAPHGYTMADLPAYNADADTHHFTELRTLLDDTLRPDSGDPDPPEPAG